MDENKLHDPVASQVRLALQSGVEEESQALLLLQGQPS